MLVVKVARHKWQRKAQHRRKLTNRTKAIVHYLPADQSDKSKATVIILACRVTGLQDALRKHIPL